jgi:endonuclease-3
VVAKKTKVKKEEAEVKVETPAGETVVRQELTVAGVGEVKAEDIGEMVADIEDIGQSPSRRAPRKWT